MEIPPAAVVSRHSETIATEIDGEVMLMSLGSGRTFGLDHRASRIWSLLEQPRTIDELVVELLRVYRTTAEQCRADVAEFIGNLAEQGLVIVKAPAAAANP